MMTNRAQTAVFYVLLAFAVAVAIFPHVPAELYRYRLNSVFVAFTCAFAWLLCFLFALWLLQWGLVASVAIASVHRVSGRRGFCLWSSRTGAGDVGCLVSLWFRAVSLPHESSNQALQPTVGRSDD